MAGCPDWLKQTFLGIAAAILGWLLLQELGTEKRLSTLETSMDNLEMRFELVTDKVIAILEKKQ